MRKSEFLMLKELKSAPHLNDRNAKEAIIITMGLSDIYYPKEGYDSTYYH
jgi:hypothetical protein